MLTFKIMTGFILGWQMHFEAREDHDMLLLFSRTMRQNSNSFRRAYTDHMLCYSG